MTQARFALRKTYPNKIIGLGSFEFKFKFKLSMPLAVQNVVASEMSTSRNLAVLALIFAQADRLHLVGHYGPVGLGDALTFDQRHLAFITGKSVRQTRKYDARSSGLLQPTWI